jgi:hypothetical protein
VELQFTPPQVSTAAGAERMVRLTAISQTDLSQTWEIDIPIRVMEVREVEILLESNIGTPRPDATLNLLFTIENRGNVDITFNPSMSLPLGWQVQSTLQPIEMAWTDNSKNILISIIGNGDAISGQLKLNLDNGSDRYSWSSDIEVMALPEPELTFKSLEFEDGRTFDHPFGPGSHPADQELIFTWLLTNDAETVWRPDILISLSQGLFGDCLDVTQVASGDPVLVICSIIIPSAIEVGSQPDFSFTLSGDDVSLVERTSLLVAESRGVDWKITGLSTIDDSGSGTIQVRLTNTGNVQLSHRLELQTTEGLTASLIEDDIVNMVAGDSQQFTVVITGVASGSQQITFQLTGTQEVTTPSTTVDIDVTASFNVSPSNSQTLLYSSVGIILVAVILLGVLLARSKKEPGVIPPDLKLLPSIVQNQPAVMCWSCHGPIIGPMQGCPSCGARYHTNETENCDADSLEACANCAASAEQFILA